MAGHGAVDHLLSGAVSDTVLVGSNVPTYIDSIIVANTTAALAYIQIFWVAAASVTLGTTVPNMVLPLPASGGAVLQFGGEGLKTRGTAWSYASTTTATGNTAAISYITIFKKR